VTRLSPAKINIGLRLLSRRPDGYHEIESFFHTLGWGDQVHLEPADEIALSVEPAPDSPDHGAIGSVPTDSTNLAWQAAAGVLELLDLPGVSIRLEKRIPPGSGLGGGSSNAAAVMSGIPHLYDRVVDPARLAALAAEIGADVPFFLRGGFALVEGIGERTTPASGMSGTAVVLAFPPVMVSTAWAYDVANYTLTRSGNYREYLESNGDSVNAGFPGNLSNDLEQAVLSAHPAIADHLSALKQTDPFFVSMTGSGSVVYGLFDEIQVAEAACGSLAARGIRTVLTELR
jgi:4-diphosphocytidyl-2-C-methyl-D-erythritol kinase